MSPYNSNQTSSVAGRRQGQCPKARGNWAVLDYLATGSESHIPREIDIAQQEVSTYLARTTSFLTQLSRWLTGAQPPGPPVPEVKQTYDTDAHGLPLLPLKSLPNEDPYPLSRETDVRAPRCNKSEWHYGMAIQESQAQNFDTLNLPDTETDDYFSSSRALYHREDHTPDTVRWPFLSPGSDEESNEEFDEETESHNFDFILLEDAYRTVHIVAGGDHEALQSCAASIVSLSSTDEVSLYSETHNASSNTSSVTLVGASTDDTSQKEHDNRVGEEYEEEEEEEEETLPARSVRLTRVGQATMIDMSQSYNTNGVDQRIGCAF